MKEGKGIQLSAKRETKILRLKKDTADKECETKLSFVVQCAFT